MADLINQFRENEVASAQSNPNILSALSGASSSPSPSSPPSSPIPTDASKITQDFSKSLYGNGFVKGGEQASNSSLDQLFQYDQMLEGQQSPFPTLPNYVENPADLYSAGAGYAQGMGSVSQAQSNVVGNTERAYTAAIAGLLDKFISFAQMREDKEYKQREREDKAKQQQYETELAIAKLIGGQVTLPDGRKIFIPADSARDAAAKPKYTPKFLLPGGAPAPTQTQKPTRPPLSSFDIDVNP